MADFRILSLDGGGSWALIQVMTLMDLFGGRDTPGHDVLRRFDLIASNSGGSIVLGGLAKNMTLGELLGTFIDPATNKRHVLFSKLGFFSTVPDRIGRLFGVGARYDTVKKFEGISAILGDDGLRRIVDLPDWLGPGKRNRKPQFLICAFDYDVTRSTFFRSDSKSATASFSAHVPATLAEAVHASSNAPVNFFNTPASFQRRRYWDGATGGYNNPALAGAIEAVANCERYDSSRDEIKMLSIGSANVVLPRAEHTPGENPDLVVSPKERSLPRDLRKLATCILDDPPDAASFHAHVLLGGAMPTGPDDDPVTDGPVVRMNPLIKPVRDNDDDPWRPPDGLALDRFKRLRDLDLDAIEQNEVEDIKVLAYEWLRDTVLNQPVRGARNSSAAEIGHHRYRDAKAQARVFDF